MRKVPGVSAVRVSLNEGLTVIDLKPDNTVTLSSLRQVIRNNGFVTKSAEITARGIVTTTGKGLTFEVSGSRERLAVEPSDQVRIQAEAVVSRAPPIDRSQGAETEGGNGSHAVSRLEAEADAAVDVAAFERRPGIDRPASIGRASRANERMPPRLPHAGQVLAVDEQPQPPELLLGEQADNHVRLAAVGIRVLFEALRPV